MAFENSPSLKDFENGIPENLPEPAQKRRNLRRVMLVLLGLVILLVGFSFLQSTAAELVSGKGSVSGVVYDDLGEPFQGYIFILGTELETQTDAKGRFLIKKVPAGKRALIVANEYAGYEFPVAIRAGETVDIGQLQFISTETPNE